MDIKITYTSLNSNGATIFKGVRTHYDTTIEGALEMLKADEPKGLKIQKIEIINQ